MAVGLSARGVGAGSAVHLVLKNSPAFIAVWLAVTRIGAWMVPVDPGSTARDVHRQVTRCRPVVTVCYPTDLPLGEHTVDTAGQTLATFAIFHLAGLQFSPRIRDIGRLQLYRLGAGSSWRAGYPHAGPLLGQPIQTQLIAEHWNDLLRLVASMKFGHTTASLLIAKLHASSRRSSLAKALHEYGRLVRTIYACRYVADEELRRRVRRQLNKGESLHALRRNLFFAHQGYVRRRHLDEQIDQALCLTLVTNACVLWTTSYLGDTIDALRADSIEVRDEIAARLTPAQHDHINFYGTYSFDIDAELRRDGHRPLRVPA